MQPLGIAENGDIYWYFGEEVGRLYIETPAKKGGAPGSTWDTSYDVDGKPVVNGRWKVKCATIEEFEAIVSEFELSSNDSENDMAEILRDIAIPNIKAYDMEVEMEREKIRKANEEREEEMRQQRQKEKAEKEKKDREKLLLQQKMAAMLAPPPLPSPTLFTPISPFAQMRTPTKPLKEITQFSQSSQSSQASVDDYLASPTPTTPATAGGTRSSGRTRSGRAVRTKSYFEVEHALDDEEEKEKKEKKLSRGKKKKIEDDVVEEDDEYKVEEVEEKDDDEDFIIEEEEEEEDDDYENVEEEDDDDEYGSRRKKKTPTSMQRRGGARPAIPNTGVMPHMMNANQLPAHFRYIQMLQQQQQAARGMVGNTMVMGGMGNLMNVPPPPQPQVFQWTTFNPGQNVFVHAPQHHQQQNQQPMHHPLIQQLQQNAGTNPMMNTQGIRPMQMINFSTMHKVVAPPPIPNMNVPNVMNQFTLVNQNSMANSQQNEDQNSQNDGANELNLSEYFK
jgi:hypothetical protein